MDAFFGYGDDRRSFLADAEERDWQLLRRYMTERRYPDGAVVLAPGDADRALLLVVRGALVSGTGARAVTFEAGTVLGELAFLRGQAAGEQVRATSDAEVLRLELARFEELSAADPALGRYLLFDLARLLAERNAELRAMVRRSR